MEFDNPYTDNYLYIRECDHDVQATMCSSARIHCKAHSVNVLSANIHVDTARSERFDALKVRQAVALD